MRKKASSQKSTSKNHKAQIRIIGGQWRGRKLPVADVEGLRPTGDRIRETLFNWLQGDIRGARCLDLFAGTGALGLEALSRHAAEVVFIEKNKTAAAQVQQNIDLLQAKNAKLLGTNTLEWLQGQNGLTPPFDLIFLDPPFASGVWNQCLELLISKQLLKGGCLIYIETPANQPLSLNQKLELLKEKTTGQVKYALLALKEIS